MGWIVLPLAGFIYLRFGYVPVAVNGPVIPFEELLAGTAVQARIAREAPATAVIPSTPDNLIEGARLYKQQCVECHGLPTAAWFTPGFAGGASTANNTSATPTAKGMFPPPPQFFERKSMGNDPVGQNYWIVANGIRLSGMPGYKASLNDQQLWQLAQFLSHRTDLPEPAARILTAQ